MLFRSYPSLMTNDAGEVAFGFTMPQSNTTWKLQLLAQTKELQYGYLSKEVITQKPLMIIPNLPRFFRQGDECTVSTILYNQTTETLTVNTSFELFNTVSEKDILYRDTTHQSISLAAGKSTTISWTFRVPNEPSGVIGCRILATSEQFSDGEQLLLPILSDEELITESKPFYLYSENEKSISFDQMTGKKPQRLTLELSANPIWYAVQALPSLAQPENENAIGWFGSYFSNALASYIVKSNPRIKDRKSVV